MAQVEAEEPENECEGFNLLKCMQRIGHNQFVVNCPQHSENYQQGPFAEYWPPPLSPPIPVSSKYLGFPKDIVKTLDRMFRVL